MMAIATQTALGPHLTVEYTMVYHLREYLREQYTTPTYFLQLLNVPITAFLANIVLHTITHLLLLCNISHHVFQPAQPSFLEEPGTSQEPPHGRNSPTWRGLGTI